MRTKYYERPGLRLAAVIGLALFSAGHATPVYALPADGHVTAGDAGIDTSGNTMTINQNTGKVAIDWRSFNIAQGEAVNFKQPNREAIALNRVVGNDPS